MDLEVEYSHRIREFADTPKSRMRSDMRCQHSMQQSWHEEEEEAMLFVHIIRMARRSVHRKLRMSASAQTAVHLSFGNVV